MRTDLLLDVVKALEIVPEEQFKISVWIIKNSCGTAGCAIGHYIFQNPNINLKLSVKDNYFCGGRIFLENDAITFSHLSSSFVAISKYFEITYEDSIYLFGGHHYVGTVTKAVVISRILKFVEDNSPPEKSSSKVIQEELVAV